MTSSIIHPDKRIWAIAGPAIISNISAAMVGLVDSWAVGRMTDPAALAGLGISVFVFNFLAWSMGFLRMGTTGMVAQAFGARIRGRLIRIIARSLVLALAVGIVLLILKIPLIALSLKVMDAAGAVAIHAHDYLAIRLWGVPLYLIKLVAVGFLIGTERAKTAMAIEIALNIANAVLTIAFVTVLGLGVAGAAAASLIAEASAGLMGFFILLRLLRPRLLRMAFRQRGFWVWAKFRALFAINGFIFLRTLFLLGVFGLFYRWSAGLGAVALAANHVLLNFVTLTSLGLDGIAYAAEALVGAAVGRRDVKSIRFWSWRSSFWAGLMSVAYAALFALFGSEIVAFITTSEAVRMAANGGLLWLALLPLIAVASYQLDGIFIGATRAQPMMWSMLISLIVFVLAAPPLMAAYGLSGLWVAMLVFFAVRALGLLIAYPAIERNAKQ